MCVMQSHAVMHVMAKGSYGSSLSLIVAYHLRSFPPEWDSTQCALQKERVQSTLKS